MSVAAGEPHLRRRQAGNSALPHPAAEPALHTPDFRLTWFCGMMIWHELASFVFLMGWLRMQMTRITWPTFVTRSDT